MFKFIKFIHTRSFRYYRTRINLLLLAILLWILVITGRDYETVMRVPLKFHNVRADKVLISDDFPDALVRFRGSGRALVALSTFKYAHIEIDLSSAQNQQEFELTTNYVKVSAALDVEPIEVVQPDSVTALLDDLSEKRLPIKPEVEITTKPGYVLVSGARVSPATIILSGPKSLLDTLDHIGTVSKTYTELRRSLREKIALSLPHPKLESEFTEVSLSAGIERLMEQRFRQIPLKVNNPPRNLGVHLDPDNITVKVRGAVSIIKSVSREDIKAYVDFPASWSEDITGVEPGISLPEGVELVDFEPDTVFMTLMMDEF